MHVLENGKLRPNHARRHIQREGNRGNSPCRSSQRRGGIALSYRGFYKRRRGILEHLEAGEISLHDLAVHEFLCLRANPIVGNGSAVPPGVCFTSAAAICALCPREAEERRIRRSLQHLEEQGWIKRWMTPGRHGNYPVLVARLIVANSTGNEYRVNTEATTNWRQPKLASAASCPATRLHKRREK